jgi:acyl transferase domain-containing protein
LPDLTYSLGVRRNHHPYRLTLTASNWAELTEELEAFAKGGESTRIRSSFSARRETAPRIGFIFSGQGPQWWGMGRELMKHEPIFRKAIEGCDAALRPWTRFSFLEELGRSEETSQMSRTEIGQPAIFAIQIALAALWKSWAWNRPRSSAIASGEIAAACVAGIFSIEEAARVIALRARLMEECGRGEGTMLAVGLPEEEAQALISRHDRTVTISAFNGPRSITLSGPRLSLEAMAAELEAQGAFARLVRVDHPFHHPLMRPAAEALEEALSDLKPQPAKIPFFSTVTGERQAGEACDAAYWGNGIRQPVRFASAVNCAGRVWSRSLAGIERSSSARACRAGIAFRAREQADDRFLAAPRTRIRIHSRGRPRPPSLRCVD